MANFRLPPVKVLPDVAVIAGGMDVVVSPMMAKPGTALLAYNYEYSTGGGLDRLRGIEPFDGHPSPASASYVYLQCAADIAGVGIGDTLDGDTSGATGVVCYIQGAYVALTKVFGDFEEEDLLLGASVVGTVANTAPTIDGFLDNIIAKGAADIYQSDIGAVPGSGPVRGIAVLNDEVYAWRNAEDGMSLGIYKASASGWTAVPLFHQVSFGTGTAEYAEGATITQGGASATVKRVVLESGTWAAGTAAGRLIITAPSGGTFTAGAASGGGACALTGSNAQITLAPGGTVRHDAHDFTARLEGKRLYGCDGVNPEFEFDGSVFVPLSTGMSATRASWVRCHKSHLFFAYRGSLQHSAIANPYVWSAVFGAGELATGDTITNLVSVGGATDAAALMVLCRNSLHVLYGTSSADWNLVPLSKISGALEGSAQDIGGVVALDTPGVIRYPATKSFGNFAWDTVSMSIQPIARNQECACSVYVSGLFKYRIFFKDGTAISGLPLGNRNFAWSVINYGRNIILAEHAEIDGSARTFYADDSGWVYEADVGRSFAGEDIEFALKLHPLTQRSPMVEKTYRHMQLEVSPRGAVTLNTSVEFYDDAGPTETIQTTLYGGGLVWDLSNYDEAYWDTPATSRKTIPCEGVGSSVSLTVAGRSNNELTHTLYAVTVIYTPRKIVR